MPPCSRTLSLTALEFFPLCLCGFGRETALIKMYPGKKQMHVKSVWFCHTASSQATVMQATQEITRLLWKAQVDMVWQHSWVKPTIWCDLSQLALAEDRSCGLISVLFPIYFSFLQNSSEIKAWERRHLSNLYGSKFHKTLSDLQQNEAAESHYAAGLFPWPHLCCAKANSQL